jgi:hypothetical protein
MYEIPGSYDIEFNIDAKDLRPPKIGTDRGLYDLLRGNEIFLRNFSLAEAFGFTLAEIPKKFLIGLCTAVSLLANSRIYRINKQLFFREHLVVYVKMSMFAYTNREE